MAAPLTETPYISAKGLETLSDTAILQLVLEGQSLALDSVRRSYETIAMAAAVMADAIRDGRVLHYVAAGSSALMAISDGLELEGTFGIERAQVRLWMAGGIPTKTGMPGHVEDDEAAAAVVVSSIAAGDVVIAVTASGSTPYTCASARLAQAKGATCIAIANVPDAKVFDWADISVCLPTPPEIIAGSTRLGAATAQKAALNMMSTLMGIRLGHVYDSRMVNLQADNEKLHNRARTMIADITGVSADDASIYLAKSGYSVKSAILLASGVATLEDANARLREVGGDLHAALQWSSDTRNRSENR